MEKENIDAIYPLTGLQHGMLFHVNYDHRSSVYVESLSFSIHGNLDVDRFKAAWEEVIERHFVLRTLFMWKNRDKPLQVVRKSVNLPWEEQDWSDLSNEDQNERLQIFLRSDQEKGFDLSRAPLMRLTLARKGENAYQFIWSYHHIIMDGWSVGNVLREVFTIYHSARNGSSIRLQEVPPYRTYVNWLQELDLEDAQSYWTEYLQGFSEPTPISLGDVPVQKDGLLSGFGTQSIYLSKETSANLQALAREHRLTLNTLFQGAWAILLSRYSGEEDILFGAAVSGRSIALPGIEEMVGLIIGSLPVRLQVDPEAMLIPWLRDLQQDQVQSRKFEYCSLRDILSWSELDRSTGQTLFDSILSFNNYEFESILQGNSGGFEIKDVSFLEGSHYPLTMLIDPGEEVRLKINFDQKRFTSSAVQRILEQLESLLEDIAAHPSRSLSEYSLLSEVEKQTFLVDFNQTDALKLDKNVVELFEQQVEKSPGSIALRYQGKTWSYAQLNEQANQLANYLSRRGVGPGKIAALLLDRSPEVVVSILGVLKAGAGYMPIDTGLPVKRIAWMLEETRAPVLLTSQKYTASLPDSRPETVFLDQDWDSIMRESSGNLHTAIKMDDLAYIIYTSGSTGKPKGAMVRHANLLNYISWAKDFYLRGEQLDFPLFSSLSFDLTITSIFVPMVSGSSIVIYPEDEASGLTVLDVFEDNLVDIVKLTPAHLALIKQVNPESTRIRKMIVGGEDFKRSLALQVSELFDHKVEIYNEYGPTEATVGCMIHRFDPDQDQAPSVPIGHPINNTQIYILDQQLNPVPTGVVGEMCIGGASVAKGYLHREDLTAQKFIANPFKAGERLYRTGDLARWTEAGQMQFLGRADHQVKLQGYRVELGEIESSILDHPAVESAVVTVVNSSDRTPQGAVKKCTQCGLPDNYPGVTFDSAGVCNTCRDFNVLKERFDPYFKTPRDLKEILQRAGQEKTGKYDCIVLYSGGKDSSYMLYQLVKTFGATPLVFSIDNGYISEEAKQNIRHVTEDLGVDLIFGSTPHMNAVFVDSLMRHDNVCDGCFKVIYTLSINLARQKGIKYIFTGLTRGQLFETRLSDMFQARIFDPEVIDQTVLAARKAYHRFDDAVSQLMDVQIFEDDHIFDDIHLVDFYRYTDVPLQEMYRYLEDNAPWVRPSDSGRSTNCLINDVGIYIHKKERGYHNYALPYSWDVRTGHKTRQEALDDLDDDINEKRVHQILSEIGYDESARGRTQLAAYYVLNDTLSAAELKNHLAGSLPPYMLPGYFIEMDQLPLTQNGKIDRQALPAPDSNQRITIETTYVAPESQVEKELAAIWAEVLNIEGIGVHDNFFEIGGDSIATIQVMMRVSQAYQLELRPVVLFNSPTIAQLALEIEDMLLAEIEMLSDEEAQSLLFDLENEAGE